MTENYDVVLARHGTWTTSRGEMFLQPGSGRADEPFVIDYYLWAIVGRERTILVDTGFSPAEAARRGRTVVRSPTEHFAALGIDSSWDGDVVLTHLHYDHTGNIASLPHARFHVAASELEYRSGGDEPDASLTTPTDIDHLESARQQGRVTIHRSDAMLAPGVELLLTPGHTPGQVMLRVGTGAGRVVLTSDVSHFDEEYERDAMFRWMTHPDEARHSYQRLRAMRDAGDEIVTGHQAGLLARYPVPPEPYGPETAIVRPAEGYRSRE